MFLQSCKFSLQFQALAFLADVSNQQKNQRMRWQWDLWNNHKSEGQGSEVVLPVSTLLTLFKLSVYHTHPLQLLMSHWCPPSYEIFINMGVPWEGLKHTFHNWNMCICFSYMDCVEFRGFFFTSEVKNEMTF
jgi:hypothetical protein